MGETILAKVGTSTEYEGLRIRNPETLEAKAITSAETTGTSSHALTCESPLGRRAWEFGCDVGLEGFAFGVVAAPSALRHAICDARHIPHPYRVATGVVAGVMIGVSLGLFAIARSVGYYPDSGTLSHCLCNMSYSSAVYKAGLVLVATQPLSLLYETTRGLINHQESRLKQTINGDTTTYTR